MRQCNVYDVAALSFVSQKQQIFEKLEKMGRSLIIGNPRKIGNELTPSRQVVVPFFMHCRQFSNAEVAKLQRRGVLKASANSAPLRFLRFLRFRILVDSNVATKLEPRRFAGGIGGGQCPGGDGFAGAVHLGGVRLVAPAWSAPGPLPKAWLDQEPLHPGILPKSPKRTAFTYTLNQGDGSGDPGAIRGGSAPGRSTSDLRQGSAGAVHPGGVRLGAPTWIARAPGSYSCPGPTPAKTTDS